MPFNIDEDQSIFEEEGVERDFEGSTFKIASVNNIKYQRLLSKLRYPYRHKIEKDSIDPEILLTIMCKSLSRTILLNWSNVINSEGEDVPYSIKAAEQALKNSLFREFVISVATESENFRAEFIEDSVK